MSIMLQCFNLLRCLLQPSLFRRLLGRQLTVVFLLLGLIFAYIVIPTYDRTNGRATDGQYQVAEAIARLVSTQPTPQYARLIALEMLRFYRQEMIGDDHMEEEDSTFQVWQHDGRLLASDSLSRGPALQPPGSLRPQYWVTRDDWVLLAAWSPDRRIWVVIGHSSRYYRQQIMETIEFFSAVAFVNMLVTLAALWIATRTGLRPLLQLAHQIEQQGSGKALMSISMQEYDELRPIVNALRTYSNRVKHMQEAERRFFADAAHELRTPLATLGAHAYALAGENDPAERASVAIALQRGAQRSAEVLSKVLTLARLDAMTTAPHLQGFDLADLLQMRVAEQVPRALGLRIDLGLDATSSQIVNGDPALIAVVLDNLIDNALRYTQKGGAVSVSYGRDGPQNWIRIKDNGPGIPAADQARVFSRFERGRNAGDFSGSGLGLAIANEIMQLHGGRLVLLDTGTDGGCCMELRWPDDWVPSDSGRSFA